MMILILSIFTALGGLAIGFCFTNCFERNTAHMPQKQRYFLSCFALVPLTIGLLGVLWCFVSPPPFSVPNPGPPDYHRNDPARSIYLGNGCFWHTQYDFFLVERSAIFGNRSDPDITSLVGYAGGDYRSAEGPVCYHGWPGTDYGRLGHSEVVSVTLDAISGPTAQAQLAAIAHAYFDHGFKSLDGGRRGRLDPQDAGPEYRNVIGLPGGMDNDELWPIIEKANVHKMPLIRGEGGPDDDKEDDFIVYIYDSTKYPFFRGEANHQFHPNTVIGRPVPRSYTVTLKKVQTENGRLDDTGCFQLSFSEITLLIVLAFSSLFSSSAMFLYVVFLSKLQCLQKFRDARTARPETSTVQQFHPP